MANVIKKNSKAWGECPKSGQKMLLRDMVQDGHYAGVWVHPDWYEPEHPQENLPPVKDDISLPRAMPKRDKNLTRLTFPMWDCVTGEVSGHSVVSTGFLGDFGIRADNVIAMVGEQSTSAFNNFEDKVVPEFTSQQSNGTVDDFTVAFGQSFALVGEQSVGAVDDFTIVTGISIALTGQASAGAVDDFTISAGNSFAMTGQASTGAVDDFVIVTGTIVTLAGQASTGAVDSFVVSVGDGLLLTGQVSTGAVDAFTVSTGNSFAMTGIASAGAVDDFTFPTNWENLSDNWENVTDNWEDA